MEVFQRGIDGLEVLLHHARTTFGVGLLDCLLDLGDGLVLRQHAREGEEAGLHHGVDAVAHAVGDRHLGGIDDVELQLLADDMLLGLGRQARPHGFRREGRIQQEGAAGLGAGQNIQPVHQALEVAGNEAGALNQVGRAHRFWAEAQVADGHRAGLLRVVHEVALGPVVRLFADDLDAVLVGADGAVGTQAVEQAAGRLGRFDAVGRIVGQAEVGDVVIDADGEALLGIRLGEFVEHRLNHRRGEFLGRQAIATADDIDVTLGFGQGRDDIQEQRVATGARLLGAVEDGEALGADRQGLEEGLNGQGTIEADDQDADFLATGDQDLGGLGGGFGTGAHDNDDPLGIGRADVLEQVVAAAGHGRELVHFGGDDVRALIVPGITGLAGLEEYVGILGRAANHRMVGVEATVAMGGDGVFVDQLAQLVVGQRGDLRDFMAGAEAIEEVHEGDAALERGGMGDGRHVVRFLDVVGRQQGPTAGTDAHDVAVITEDRQGVGGQTAGRHVEDRRDQLTGNLVHVGDHQQQALGRREGRRQGAGHDRAVAGAGGTTFRLHLDHRRDLAPEVHLPLGRPFIGMFAHVGRGGDGIDGDDFAAAVSH